MKTIIAVIFLVFVIIIGMTAIEENKAIFYSGLSASVAANATGNNSSSIEEEKVSVTLSGQVATPGKYTIDKGDYLDEAIELAGGLTSKADSDCFDYYFEITEDMSIYIAPITDDEKVSLNEGTLAELVSLPGIGNTIAGRMITYRETNDGFSYLEEVMKVEGIGKSIFNSIKDKICL